MKRCELTGREGTKEPLAANEELISVRGSAVRWGRVTLGWGGRLIRPASAGGAERVPARLKTDWVFRTQMDRTVPQ